MKNKISEIFNIISRSGAELWALLIAPDTKQALRVDNKKINLRTCKLSAAAQIISSAFSQIKAAFHHHA